MKKIFLLLAVITVCTIAYFNMGPEEQQYLDQDDVLAYVSKEPEVKQYMEESDIQSYLNMGFEEKLGPEENDFQAYTPKKKRYYPVKDYKPRESTLGFSITPPPGSNWFEKLEEGSLYYVKINKLHKQYAILTEAREVHLSKNMRNTIEMQSYVKKERERALVSSTFKEPNLSVLVEESQSEKCVRYSQSYQQHGLKGLGGGRYVNVDTQGLFCLHPDNARVAVDLNYVEKSLSDSRVKSYSSEGEKFLGSLKFN